MRLLRRLHSLSEESTISHWVDSHPRLAVGRSIIFADSMFRFLLFFKISEISY